MSETNFTADELPLDFVFGGHCCGVKESGQMDLAVFCSQTPATTAAVYTQNKLRASSINRNDQLTPSGRIQAVVVNSGNANACTGDRGEQDNLQMASDMAGNLNLDVDSVLTLSTGVIGKHLPIEKISSGIHDLVPQLGSTPEHFDAATKAILTTDQFTKVRCRKIDLPSQTVRIAACAKGAGMIGPQMATLLCIVMTDMTLDVEQAQQVLHSAVQKSFNCISVEGHTSTNDAVILLANGQSDSVGQDDIVAFENNLTEICIDLAKMIPADGEGATHLISISVQGTADDMEADRIARTVASSALVKTAIYGNDPNWGRIMSAVGNVPLNFSMDECRLEINGHSIFENGHPIDFDENVVSRSITESVETRLKIVVGTGPGEAQHWTSDLSTKYVEFNSEYTT